MSLYSRQCLIALSLIVEGLSGCAHVENRESTDSLDALKVAVRNAPPVPKVITRSTDSLRQSKTEEKNNLFLVESNIYIQRWIKYFSEKDRERFQRFLNRGQSYKTIVENVLLENDLPSELYYLAMIESGYRTDALSNAKAAGVWQFIAGTASRYGLRVDRHVDERRDPIRATEAAAKYLRDLFNVFGSWHLALAAYNAGEIRILRAIFKARTRDFWELADSKALPTETADYVPKFLAVVLIGKEPEKYGFKISEPGVAYPNLEAVDVPSSLKLSQLAQISGLSLESLIKVNPQLITSGTPPQPTSYEIWIPAESAGRVRSLNQVLVTLATRRNRQLASQSNPSKAGTHIVKRGESLSTIALRYKVSVGHLMRINGLRSGQIKWGMKLRTKIRAYASNLRKYMVKKNDSLTFIAQKFKSTIKRIKEQNNLRTNRIFAGQVLQIPISD